MENNLKTQEEKQKKAQEIFSYLPTEGLSEERRYCFAVDMFNYHSGIAYYTASLVSEYFKQTDAKEFEVLCNGEASVLFYDGHREDLGLDDDVIVETFHKISLNEKVGNYLVNYSVKYYAKDNCIGNDLSLQNCLYDIMRAALLNSNPNYVIKEKINDSGIRCLSVS